MFKDPSDTYNSDTLLTDDTKLTVTEASVFGEEKLPIQHLCASAMERTHELSKSIEEIEAIRMESILVISSGIGGSVNKMQLQRQAVANRGRTSSIGERQNQTQSKEVKSAGSRIEELEQDRLQLDELSNSLEMCANDETHSEAMFKGMERTKGTVESFLDQKSKELTSLASRLCPEDSALVESWIDLHRKRAEARASEALFVAVLGRKNTKRRGRPFTDMQQRELQGPKEYVALTKRTYSDSRAHLQEAFHSTYDEKSVGGLPTCVAGWTELWTSPQQQIGQVRLKTALLHPEGDEAHEKAEISQWAVYSVDGGASWAPVAGTIEADGEPFEAPNVNAWQLLDSRGVLPSEHASTTWMQDLDDYLPAPMKEASGESGGSSMPSTHADQMATDWRVTRKPGESRSG
ncbi:hypothetical protein I316_04705 [Kwoniella heveanensis BCC8398]|uniref:Uncharacterized protein n=1 Tax=Kwoniella heveanensis BCC8398 TaxID=1296120 RepID=A0A1B9GRG4_9TREE|nr:hypothetical protein I316_04705 [Kwoniella heveanensis BCC8398]